MDKIKEETEKKRMKETKKDRVKEKANQNKRK